MRSSDGPYLQSRVKLGSRSRACHADGKPTVRPLRRGNQWRIKQNDGCGSCGSLDVTYRGFISNPNNTQAHAAPDEGES
jgi:hypothetical protein